MWCTIIMFGIPVVLFAVVVIMTSSIPPIAEPSAPHELSEGEKAWRRGRRTHELFELWIDSIKERKQLCEKCGSTREQFKFQLGTDGNALFVECRCGMAWRETALDFKLTPEQAADVQKYYEANISPHDGVIVKA